MPAVETATLAGGCFWCLEAAFEQLQGISRVVSGYTGGRVRNPDYRAVCEGTTGHAEAVQIEFDPAVISYRDLLRVFFTIHDPTTLNRQGVDVGTQYRSAIYYHAAAQRDDAEAVIRELTEAGHWNDPIVTEVTAASEFYPAEAHHQGYFRRNASQPYCAAVVAPKVAKVRKEFFTRLFLAVLSLLAISLGTGLGAQTAPPATIDAVVARIDSVAQAALYDPYVAGISVAVVHQGRVVLARGYGLANLGAGLPATDTTPFAIGSVTKQFTTAAALLLAEEGKLSMDDKVAKWFPSLTRAQDITLGDLVHHVSGYPDYYPLDFVDRRMATPTTADAVIAGYAKGRLDFEPGAHWSYSNTGYFVLGRIVERVSGMSFGAFLERRFFRPLGMTHTRYEPAPGTTGIARGYAPWALGSLQDALPEARGWTGAAGGIFAPAGDLAKWDVALMEGKVLKPASWAWVTTPRQLNDGSNSSYGGGQFLGYVKGWQLLDHGGAVSGFLASNTVVPGSRSAFVVMVNSEYFAAPIKLRSTALDFFLADSAPAAIAVQPPAGAAPAEPPVPAVAGMTAEEAARMMFKSLQTGTVDRRMLSKEHDFFLSEDRLRRAAMSLGPLGEPQAVETGKPRERGGLEVTSTRFTFPDLVVRGLMYRRPDGTIEEFLVTKQ